ncbi:MAG: serine/threonine protein kinase [Phycisphaerales bacterium]
MGEAKDNPDAGPDRALPPSNASQGAWVSDGVLPRQVGKYTLGAKLGEGGMGVVFAAVHQGTGGPAAVKVLRGAPLASDTAKRFEQEARVLARLSHPSIATPFDAGSYVDPVTGDRVPYFAMEYVEAPLPITTYCEAHGLRISERLGLFVQACDAVQHGHGRAVLHRDIKPANIVVGKQGIPKLIDFGISRPLELSDALREGMTRHGQVLGTLQYMSPEQLSGDSSRVDVRSDVYSLGIVLYELVTGGPPYRMSLLGVHEATQVLRDARPPKLTGVQVARREDLEAVVQKALAKDAGLRYQTAAELADDLRRYLAHEPVKARRYSKAAEMLHGPRRVLRSNRALAMVLVLVAGVLTADAVDTRLRSTGWGSDAALMYDSLVARAGAPTPVDLSCVRLIVGDADRRQIEARANGLEIPDPDAPGAGRELIAKIVADAAQAGAPVAMLDYTFYGDGVRDLQAAAYLRRAAEAGMPVVIGDPTWRPDAEAMISVAIASEPSVYRGVIIMDRPAHPWLDRYCGFSTQRRVIFPSGGTARASLAFTALALLRAGPLDPASPVRLTFAPAPGRQAIDAGVVRPSRVGVDPWSESVAEVVARAPVAEFRLISDDEDDFSAQPGEMYASALVGRFPSGTYQPVLKTFEEFGAMTPEQRREWIDRKAVLIANVEPLELDYYSDGRGGLVPGCFSHAQEYAELNAGISLSDRSGSLWYSWPWVLAGAGAGLWAGWCRGNSRRAWGILIILGTAVAAVAASACVWAFAGVMASQVLTLLSVLITFGWTLVERSFTLPPRRGAFSKD